MDVAVVASVTWSGALQIAWNKREYTNMAVVTSCENDLLEGARHHAHPLDSGDKTLGISSVLILKKFSLNLFQFLCSRSILVILLCCSSSLLSLSFEFFSEQAVAKLRAQMQLYHEPHGVEIS